MNPVWYRRRVWAYFGDQDPLLLRQPQQGFCILAAATLHRLSCQGDVNCSCNRFRVHNHQYCFKKYVCKAACRHSEREKVSGITISALRGRPLRGIINVYNEPARMFLLDDIYAPYRTLSRIEVQAWLYCLSCTSQNMIRHIYEFT